MSDDQYDAALTILRSIQHDVTSILTLVRETSATIDRILELPLSSGPAYAQA